MVLVYWSKDNSSRTSSVFCVLHALRKTALCHQQNWDFFCLFFSLKKKVHIEIKVTSYSWPQVCYSQLSEMNKPKLSSKFVLARSLPYVLGTLSCFLIRTRDGSYKAISAYSTPSPPPSCHSQQYWTKYFKKPPGRWTLFLERTATWHFLKLCREKTISLNLLLRASS